MNLNAQDKLMEHGLRPSVQRVAIMEYLMQNRTHPTAEDIFEALRPTMSTLALATVYNTLALLVKNGAAQALDVDFTHVHYDGETAPHAHFVCSRCGAIHDIMPTERGWRRVLKAAAMPDGTQVQSVQLTVKGVCAKCAAAEQVAAPGKQ